MVALSTLLADVAAGRARFDPARRLFFVTAHETCAIWTPRKPTPPINLGVRVPSGGRTLVPGREQWAALRSEDREVWATPPVSGLFGLRLIYFVE